jgi:hypothetical protein
MVTAFLTVRDDWMPMERSAGAAPSSEEEFGKRIQVGRQLNE